jgi:hypothetical protein
MKRVHLLLHLSLPAAFALFGFAAALRSEGGVGPASLGPFLGGLLYYAAPHLTWAALCAAIKPSLQAWHAGFFLSSAVLAFIGVMSFFSHDRSGLPMQWFLYWPLAGAMLLLVAVVWLLSGRPRAGA